LDENGKINLCYGSDGHSVSYEDSAILNYRKVESWDLLVEDITSLASKHDINGVHLDNCQAWPQLMTIDSEEMYREDCDGKRSYSNIDILNGEVVKRDEDSGYWNSSTVDSYANPMLIKLCKEVWGNYYLLLTLYSSISFLHYHR